MSLQCFRKIAGSLPQQFVSALKSIFWITLNIFCLNLSWDLKNNFTWPSFLFSKFFFGTLSQFLGSLLFPRNFYVKGMACTLTKKRKMWSSFKQTDVRSSNSMWLNKYVFWSRKRPKLDIKWSFVNVSSFLALYGNTFLRSLALLWCSLESFQQKTNSRTWSPKLTRSNIQWWP